MRFERLLLEISSRFIDLPNGRIDEAIDDGLRKVVTTLGIDRCTLSTVDHRTGHFHSNHSWAEVGFLPVPRTVSSRTYPWALARFRAGLPVVFARLRELPPEAAVDAASYASIGLRAHVGMPVMVSGEFNAVLGFAALRSERAWPEALIARMRLLADVFGSALARKRAQDRIEELLAFERLLVDLSATLLESPGTVLDAEFRKGLQAIATLLGADRISLWSRAPGTTRFFVSHQWIVASASDMAESPGAIDFPWIVDEIVAGNIVRIPSIADNAPGAEREANALRDTGARSLLVTPLHGADTVVGAMSLSSMRAERHWSDELVPRLGLMGRMLLGALVHRGTEQRARQAAADASQSRERLAHLARVDAVGAMSAAITHEINQPLMAIENYAHAGRRRLAGTEAIDRIRLDQLLEKIAGQAALASEVLEHLRATVKRREPQEARVDLSMLIDSALQLIDIEGRLKDVRIETAVATNLPAVLGDEVQIQQVIMNLAHNAMDAMSAVAADARVLRLEAVAADDDRILVRVADSGAGIAEEEREHVFEPFHTTKEAGLGIGLAICRTIVEGHGGKLWHAPNAGGGTVFQFTLPAAS